MGHDIHFLERVTARANPEHQAMALALYRDPQLIQHIALHFAPLLLGEADRMALALADGKRGPHVIVTKQGKFVTCLGAGMDVGDTPVISRALLEECEAWRKRPVEDDPGVGKMLVQMARAMDVRAPSRAEVEQIEAVGGLYVMDFMRWIYPEEDLLSKLEQTLQRRSARRNQLGKTFNGTIWDLKRAWLSQQRMAAFGGPLFALCLPQLSPIQRITLDEGLPALMLAGPAQHCTPMSIMWTAWSDARVTHGEELIDEHARIFLPDDEDYVYQQGGRFTSPLGLYMWGLRHPERRAWLLGELDQAIKLMRFVTSEPVVWAGLERTRAALEEGLDALPLAERLKRLATQPWVHHAAWQAPLREVAGRGEEELLWELLCCDGALIDAAGEDWLLWAYAPMMVDRPVRELFPESPRVWTRPELEARADALLRARQARKQRVLLQEVRSSKPAQGRNEPCACGSGKKYKRCCGQGSDEEG